MTPLSFDFSQIVFAGLTAGLVGLLAFVIASNRKPSISSQRSAGGKPEQLVLLFDQEVLIDASTKARELLETAPDGLNDWQRMQAVFGPRFAGLKQKLEMLDQNPCVAVPEATGPASLLARRSGQKTRLSVLEPDAKQHDVGIDAGRIFASQDRAVLRTASENAPHPIWNVNQFGMVDWANKAYLDLAQSATDEDQPLSWPLPELFTLPTPEEDSETQSVRVHLNLPGQDPQWFECCTRPCADGRVHFAVPINGTVRSETLLTSFIQTMTKTFADLPTGVAIFSKERQLTLFNPALTDLLQLDSGYLATRPNLISFMDHLRTERKLPEPKDYKSWRHRLDQLESATEGKGVVETWTLENGLTYRATIRPHGSGALAFLVDDISGEVALTRRFQVELDLAQAALDGLEDAVVVFSASGQMVRSNQAYRQLWQAGQTTSTVQEATRHWRSLCRPSPIWGEIRDFVTDIGERASWQDRMYMLDGTELSCTCTPIAGDATLISFAPGQTDALPTKTRRQSEAASL